MSGMNMGLSPALARSQQDHQRPTPPIDHGVDLGAQPAWGPADGMVIGLGESIVVI